MSKGVATSGWNCAKCGETVKVDAVLTAPGHPSFSFNMKVPSVGGGFLAGLMDPGVSMTARICTSCGVVEFAIDPQWFRVRGM